VHAGALQAAERQGTGLDSCQNTEILSYQPWVKQTLTTQVLQSAESAAVAYRAQHASWRDCQVQVKGIEAEGQAEPPPQPIHILVLPAAASPAVGVQCSAISIRAANMSLE
jgi:hypothetical protein